MKKIYSVIVLIALFSIPVFANDGEEVDFLLFSPNRSDQFVNEEAEKVHLDNLAAYLLGRKDIRPGQIRVHGYAAAFKNDIDPVELSQDRARFVIQELENRGVPANLFSSPDAHGEVDLWGADDADKNPNRRVRIVLDGNVLTAAAFAPIEIAGEEKAATCIVPWLLALLFALLAGLLLFALLKARKKIAALMAASESTVNLEEEIRRRAYYLYMARNGENGDAQGDWHKAVPEVCARYQIEGDQVYTENGNWWATHRYAF
jgi:hypothetical protein